MHPDWRILYLEDQGEAVDRVGLCLRQDYLAFHLTWVKDQAAFEAALAAGWSFDLLFLGDPPAGFAAGAALALAQARCPLLPVVMLPAALDEDLAAAWLRQGAACCVPRAGLVRLVPVVRRLLEASRDQAALREARAENARLTSLLRTVLDATSEGVLVVDLAGQITTYNRKFMSLCGVPEYVLAPMELDRVLRFLQEQFLTPETFLNEVRLLGDTTERRSLGIHTLGNRRQVQAFGRSQRLDGETVGRVYSFREVPGAPAEPAAPLVPVAPMEFLEAARAGRVVPWYLTEEELVISEKGLAVLDLASGDLPRDLPALEAMIHPEDLDQFRRGLERPQSSPFSLRLRRRDGAWIATRWNLKRGAGGYRGVFTEIPQPRGVDGSPDLEQPARFNYQVQVLEEEPQP